MSTVTRYLLGTLLTVAAPDVYAQQSAAVDSSQTTKAPAQPLKPNLLPPLRQMMAAMNKLKPTGDPEVDFVRQALAHTQGTRALLKAVVAAQPDSMQRQVAQTMLFTAETDLASLNNLLKTRQPKGRNAAFVKQQKRVLAAIGEKIKQSASMYKLTPNAGVNIFILLRDQQQDAVNLATTYLLFGKDVAVRNFAQQAVEKAKLDLDVLKNVPGREK